MSAPTALADPAATEVECKDGKTVTAKIDDAAPNDLMNVKDYNAACKGHGGYTAPDDGGDGGGDGGGSTSECGGVETTVIKCAQTNDPKKGIQGNGAWGILLIAINILTAGVGVAAVGGLIYAGIIYATASNDQAKIVKAKDTIYNVVLGIVMYALMWAFIQYLVPGGVFK